MAWVLYTRRGCHLCELAEDMLATWLPDVDVVDVDADAEAVPLYGCRVPVLLRDGTVVMEGRFHEPTLASLLAKPAC